MRLKKVDPLSCAKISGLLYAILGVLFGALFSLISLVGASLGDFPAGMLFGAGAVIILPIFYGVLGFVMGALSAFLYNLLAGWVGGVEVEFEQDSVSQQTPQPMA